MNIKKIIKEEIKKTLNEGISQSDWEKLLKAIKKYYIAILNKENKQEMKEDDDIEELITHIEVYLEDTDKFWSEDVYEQLERVMDDISDGAPGIYDDWSYRDIDDAVSEVFYVLSGNIKDFFLDNWNYSPENRHFEETIEKVDLPSELDVKSKDVKKLIQAILPNIAKKLGK